MRLALGIEYDGSGFSGWQRLSTAGEVAPDGSLLGEKQLDFRADPHVPLMQYRLRQPAYEERLTAVDAGTRAGRFMLQDLLGTFVPALKHTDSWGANVLATAGCVALWGYLLYQGVIDPLGGINTLWPLFGISNQMLAGIALMLATVVLIKMKRQRYIWVTMLPAVWLLICTTTAGLIKLFDANPAIGFLSLAKKYSDALANGQVLAPAKSVEQMQHVIFNAYTNATLTGLFLFVVFSILFYALKVGIAAWGKKERTDKESPFQALPDA